MGMMKCERGLPPSFLRAPPARLSGNHTALPPFLLRRVVPRSPVFVCAKPKAAAPHILPPFFLPSLAAAAA